MRTPHLRGDHPVYACRQFSGAGWSPTPVLYRTVVLFGRTGTNQVIPHRAKANHSPSLYHTGIWSLFYRMILQNISTVPCCDAQFAALFSKRGLSSKVTYPVGEKHKENEPGARLASAFVQGCFDEHEAENITKRRAVCSLFLCSLVSKKDIVKEQAKPDVNHVDCIAW